MNYEEILAQAGKELVKLNGKTFDILNISKPESIEYALQLAKVISKLSPLIGNMIEFSTVSTLNKVDWNNKGKWIRQDPGFPDALFQSVEIQPNPGIEIKAWFPFATEITARFKDSITIFKDNNIDMALIAWLPEFVIWGKPKIIDVVIVSGKSVAEARDSHYHNPPEYLVFEPEDTQNRTQNLQQTNTNGYVFQHDKSNIEEARKVVDKWGTDKKKYDPSPKYQRLLQELLGQFKYRLDTNYAKIDRIEHKDIEKFKEKVLDVQFNGKTIKDWSKLLSSGNESALEDALGILLG